MSEYICSTPSCAIALSKAAFPVSMNCPVCQQALTELIEKPLLSEEDEQLISNLPYVIAYPLKRTLLEKHPWTKINLLKDTFLNYLKYIGLITASEFFNSPLKDKKMVALFQQALAEPSFGSWNQYIRETLSYLKENNHSFFCPDLLSYYDLIESGKKRKLFKGEIEIMDANGDIQIKKQEATAIGMLINFRNRYLGHGLTLDESDAVNHWEIYFPIFRELLVQLKFSAVYPMFKCEHGETYLLKSAEISLVEKGNQTSSRVWIENPEGNSMDILPFFVVPGEVSIGKEDKEQLLAYESYTGKTIKFFSPEGTEKQTSGKILEKLNLLLRDKQKETPFSPEAFTKDEFLKRIAEENKLLLDTLISEKKIVPGIYQHREEMEIKLREWIGARANIFFIVAEAGSGKTNLLVEMQRQYTERELPSLLIRAARMEKQSLKEQIAYLLNIDLQVGLVNYASIAGTQAQPTFILIDGLNEANNAEEIWQDIIDMSKVFITGSIKFVVTNRANTKSELSRYIVSENDFNLLYGENKDHEIGLGAYSYWLTSLDMQEMKGAWKSYVTKNRTKFNPQFNFDDIALFDRGLYDQINNPLILRLFLEIYNGKVLPKKGMKHLNIWKDWLVTFSEAEQTFLKLLANEVWQKGENELLLDDLLQNETLKPYFTSDIINSPYNRLKNNGWISRYVKDLNGYIGFTVEGALLHVLGQYLQFQHPKIGFNELETIIKEGNKLKNASVEVFLCQKAIAGDLALISKLIDKGDDNIFLCLNALIVYVKTFGIKSTLDSLLLNPTQNDWKAFLEVDKRLIELQLNELRNEYLLNIMINNKLDCKESLTLGIRALTELEKNEVNIYLPKIYMKLPVIEKDEELLFELANLELKNGKYDESIQLFEKCKETRIKKYGTEHISISDVYNCMGIVYHYKCEYNKSLDYFYKSLELGLKFLGEEHSEINDIYCNIASVWDSKLDHDKALEFFQKSLDIILKNNGEFHLNVVKIYQDIGIVWHGKKDTENAKKYLHKSLDIGLKVLREEDVFFESIFNNLGLLYDDLGESDKALEFYQKSLQMRLKQYGNEHPNIASVLNNIGFIYSDKNDYNKALEFFQKSLFIKLKCLGKVHYSLATTYSGIGFAYKELGEYKKALDSYQKSERIRWEYKELHNSIPKIKIHIGHCLQKTGKYKLAIDAYQDAVKIVGKEAVFFNLGECQEEIGLNDDALKSFISSAEILKDKSEKGMENLKTIESITNVLRLAKKLKKEDELPDWIKNIEL
jgi:tetratricopeptide (TPR) repeat protein